MGTAVSSFSAQIVRDGTQLLVGPGISSLSTAVSLGLSSALESVPLPSRLSTLNANVSTLFFWDHLTQQRNTLRLSSGILYMNNQTVDSTVLQPVDLTVVGIST